ncbi:MAG: thioesterase domain-containing protein [Bacillota bacterium]|nr:thioesterase domain-containing protein [Bacillota bacterium]
MNKYKIFFLPYAGASAAAYASWKKYLNHKADVYPVELKGRGRRFNESFYENMEEAVEDVFKIVSREIGENKYVIYGHSMGTILAYELNRRIRKEKLKEPEHIFLSGRNSPGTFSPLKDIHLLNDDDFALKIAELGGTSKEVFENYELRSIFLPIMKADFKIVDSYVFNNDFKLRCGITVINGKQDKMVSYENTRKWEGLTEGDCKYFEFDGDHFFINDYKKEISQIINDTLY